MKVVATGGLGRLVSAETKEIDIYNPTLTLTGLLLLYRKNRKSNPRIDEYEE